MKAREWLKQQRIYKHPLGVSAWLSSNWIPWLVDKRETKIEEGNQQTCCIIRLRHWWAAMFSCKSLCSGALPGRRRSGLDPEELPTLRWKSDGARHTAKLLAVICWEEELRWGSWWAFKRERGEWDGVRKKKSWRWKRSQKEKKRRVDMIKGKSWDRKKYVCRSHGIGRNSMYVKVQRKKSPQLNILDTTSPQAKLSISIYLYFYLSSL